MSLLMEALRKAEAAKSKATKEQPSAPGQPVGDEPAETPDPSQSTPADLETIEFNTGAPPREAPMDVPQEPDPEDEFTDDDTDFDDEEYDEIYDDEDEDAEESGDDYDPRVAEEELLRFEGRRPDSDLAGGTAGQEEPVVAADAPAASGMADRQTAHSLFRAKHAARRRPAPRTIALAAMLILLFPIGGGFYWYYNSTMTGSTIVAGNTPPPPAPPVDQGPAQTPAGAASANADTAQSGATNEAGQETASTTPEAETPAPQTADTGQPTDQAATAQSAGTQSQPSSPPANPVQTTAGNQTPPAESPAQPAVQGPGQTGQQEAESAPQLTLRRTTPAAGINPELREAYNAFQSGNVEDARSRYQSILDSQPNNRDAVLGLATIYRREGNAAMAQNLYSRLLQLNPRDPLARAGLLEISRNNDPTAQESELRALRQQYPDVAPLAFAMGNLYASQGRWSEAQSAYFSALAIARSRTEESGNVSPDYAFNLAISLERLGQLEPARDYYRQALELASAYPGNFNADSARQRLNYLEGALQ